MSTSTESLVAALTTPLRKWSRSEVLARPSPVPQDRGIYAWYFRDIPNLVPVADCHTTNGFTLLYVGVAPATEASRATLRSRIRTHLRGNAAGSTLRLTLGCLLSDQLGLTLRKTGRTDRLTFGEGENILSSWLDKNAFVVWATCSQPWQFEAQIIQQLSPPLNLDHNQRHPFHASLMALRALRRREAREALDRAT